MVNFEDYSYANMVVSFGWPLGLFETGALFALALRCLFLLLILMKEEPGLRLKGP